jgi:hypothetical protein
VPSRIFKNNEKLIFVDFSRNKILKIGEIYGNFFNLDKFVAFGNPNYNFEMSIKNSKLRIAVKTRLFDKQNRKFYNFFGQPLNYDGNFRDFLNLTVKCYEELGLVELLSRSCENENVQQITSRLQLTGIINERDDVKFANSLKILSQIMHYLPNNISIFFPNLKTLTAAKGIKEIFRENFEGLPELASIYLESNDIEYIDDDQIFQHNPNLQNIDLSENRIKRISANVFINLIQLRTVNLNFNDCIYDESFVLDYDGNSSNPITNVCGADLPRKFKIDIYSYAYSNKM